MKGRDQLLVSTVRRLSYKCSRGIGSALGEKGKKLASEASQEVVFGGERVAAFSPPAGLGSLADIFPF